MIGQPIAVSQRSHERIAYPFIRRELNQIDNHTRGLRHFYTQLERLERGDIRTVNIVHIGDSHIQADWFSGQVRQLLHKRFGSAGRGLIFPYRLAKTNGPIDLHASSNASWQAKRHVQVKNPLPVGVTGITIQTVQHGFSLSVSVDSADQIPYDFNKITLFTDNGPSYYDWSVISPSIGKDASSAPEKPTPSVKYHKVETGETLSGIAEQYKTSVVQLMEFNNLTSSMIYAGQTLRVSRRAAALGTTRGIGPTTPSVSQYPCVQSFYLPYATQRVTLTAQKHHSEQQLTRLYGMVLENYQRKGVLYHMIGVNSARFKHYNASPGFFEQLQALQPDLVIISLGTNEVVLPGFNGEGFFEEIDACIHLLEQHVPFAGILLTAPPDTRSRRPRDDQNVEVASTVLRNYALSNDLAAWNFFDIMGGDGAIETWYEHGLAQADRVHLSRAGYEIQGQLLYNALMRGYGAFRAGR